MLAWDRTGRTILLLGCVSLVLLTGCGGVAKLAGAAGRGARTAGGAASKVASSGHVVVPAKPVPVPHTIPEPPPLTSHPKPPGQTQKGSDNTLGGHLGKQLFEKGLDLGTELLDTGKTDKDDSSSRTKASKR
ncbi:MAG: hypothetical protein NZ703_06420 [Gemmataceae bacterium]|nr:hypothetical protein [Gemmataceae bacterium]